MAGENVEQHRMPDELTRLFERLANPLYRYAYSRLGQKLDAEEAVQDTFVALAKRSFDKKIEDSYVYRALHNRCVDLVRRKNRRVQEVAIDWAASLGIEDKQRLHDIKMLEQALVKLPPEQRDVIILRYFCEMTLQEISFVQEVSVATVASRQRYALERLRLHFTEQDGPERIQ